MALAACSPDPVSGVLPGGPALLPEPPAPTSLRLAPGDLPTGVATLRFSVTPFLDTGAMRRNFEPTSARLGAVLGVPVELRLHATYGEQIDAAVDGDVDIVALSPLSYVIARQRDPDLRLLAAQLAHGSSSYSSYVLVDANDPAQDLKGLKGRRIAFVDENSTSGFLFPYAAFLDAGVDPERDFAEVVFAGSHAGALTALAVGQVDVACSASGLLGPAGHSMTAADELTPHTHGDFRILHKAGRIPYDAVCLDGRFGEEAAHKVAGAFLGLNTRTAQGRAALSRPLQISGWVPADDATYDPVRRVYERVSKHRAAARAAAAP